jgi:hypothetical protein
MRLRDLHPGARLLLGHKASHVTRHYSAADISNLIAASEKVRDLGSRKSPAVAIVRARGASPSTQARDADAHHLRAFVPPRTAYEGRQFQVVAIAVTLLCDTSVV